MNRLNKVLLIIVVCSLGLWGCTQGPAGTPNAEKVKVLEGKYTKLEEDYRALSAAREQLRRKLGESEDLRSRAAAELREREEVVKERDELRQQVSVRTTERDAAQVQMEQLRKGIRGLLNQVETSAATPAQPATAASVTQVVAPPTF